MGQALEPEPAALVIGVLFGRDDKLEESLSLLSRLGRPVRRLEGEVPFDYTDYYSKEMGPGLRRGLLMVEEPVPREHLVWWKERTNEIERQLSDQQLRRQVNLDPGLLSLENLVLATTKGRDHRVYLGRGIYAEVTLRFHRGQFQPLEWTYPDWKHPQMLQMLDQVRQWLYKELRQKRREG